MFNDLWVRRTCRTTSRGRTWRFRVHLGEMFYQQKCIIRHWSSVRHFTALCIAALLAMLVLLSREKSAVRVWKRRSAPVTADLATSSRRRLDIARYASSQTAQPVTVHVYTEGKITGVNGMRVGWRSNVMTCCVTTTIDHKDNNGLHF